METLLVPPEFKDIDPYAPLGFLGGPVQGAPNWQRTAAGLILENPHVPKDIYLASPRREAMDATFNKAEQIRWEQRHLSRAAVNGAILFWLAKESPDAPAPNKPGRAYAQTTRIEIGMAIGWKQALKTEVNIVLGIEPGYTGNADYFRITAEENDIFVHDSLEDACDQLSRVLSLCGIGTYDDDEYYDPHE